VSVDELAARIILGGEPTSGTATLLQNVLGPAAARLPATVKLGSTPRSKKPCTRPRYLARPGSAADADRRAGGLHTLPIDGPPFRKALWLAHRGAVVPEDPAVLFTDIRATPVA